MQVPDELLPSCGLGSRGIHLLPKSTARDRATLSDAAVTISAQGASSSFVDREENRVKRARNLHSEHPLLTL